MDKNNRSGVRIPYAVPKPGTKVPGFLFFSGAKEEILSSPHKNNPNGIWRGHPLHLPLEAFSDIVGGIHTAMREAYIKQHPEALEIAAKSKAIPPYCSEAEEVAAAALFACDPACRTMTGSEITVDAGMLIM